jgi:hypothetical protein
MNHARTKTWTSLVYVISDQPYGIHINFLNSIIVPDGDGSSDIRRDESRGYDFCAFSRRDLL